MKDQDDIVDQHFHLMELTTPTQEEIEVIVERHTE